MIVSRWTHRPTWPDCRQHIDRSIFREGERVGRTYMHEFGPQGGSWAWFGAWIGTDNTGTTQSLPEALEAVRRAVPENSGHPVHN